MLRSSMRRVMVVAAPGVSSGHRNRGRAGRRRRARLSGGGCFAPFLLMSTASITAKVHEFTDANGNDVQLITGLAGPVTFTNTDTGASLTAPARGAVWKLVTTPDGRTTTFTATGHFVLILFPEDVPAGPSTTLYVGRVVFTIDNLTGVFTLQETRGTAADLYRGAVRLTPGAHWGKHTTVSPVAYSIDE